MKTMVKISINFLYRINSEYVFFMLMMLILLSP